MKDLGPARKVLGMVIERNKSTSCLKIHQYDYLLKVVQKFGMSSCKLVNIHLGGHFILFKSQYPSSDSEKLKKEKFHMLM